MEATRANRDCDWHCCFGGFFYDPSVLQQREEAELIRLRLRVQWMPAGPETRLHGKREPIVTE
jgi:hypothetical protein